MNARYPHKPYIDAVLSAVSDLAAPGGSLDFTYEGGQAVMEAVIPLADEVIEPDTGAASHTVLRWRQNEGWRYAVRWSDDDGADEPEQLITAKVPAPESLALAARRASTHSGPLPLEAEETPTSAGPLPAPLSAAVEAGHLTAVMAAQLARYPAVVLLQAPG
ncbi:hypothetical protein ABIA33_002793 [Streptacidiphilus sp. MAP12-16]|uniref:hypothetical protein n=1 Tax=Streptacidiphilus sp. MAP12-16 TaxID=3156300 RepID=UPI0035132128